jgi:hypothetical protein
MVCAPSPAVLRAGELVMLPAGVTAFRNEKYVCVGEAEIFRT